MTDTSVTQNQPDQAALIAAEATRLANAQMEKMKRDLSTAIGGEKQRYGENGPGSWDRVIDDSAAVAVERAKPLVEQAKAEIRAEFEAKEKARAEQFTKDAEMRAAQEKHTFQKMDQEWKEAVNDGLMPDISESLKEKLSKAPLTFDQLTPDEQNDPGLVAYNQARALHVQLASQGKSNSFYRTVSKFLNAQPAGANAPVLGGSPAVTQKSEDYDYAEVAANRRKKFGF